MNLQDLIYFTHLAESLSFTETAESFYVSQPSISMSLKRLESEFETTLIDRRKTLKRIQLTSTGRILYENTKEILNLLDVTKQKIHDLQDETIYYGFLPTIGGYLLPRILPQLSRYTKSIKFIEEESSDIMLRMVKNGDVPIAIIGHDKEKIADNAILQVPILQEEIGLWVAPNHPLAGQKNITADQLEDEVFIALSEGYTHQRIFEDWTQAQFKNDPNVVYAKEINTVLSIASSTNMVAFMSDIIVNNARNLVKVTLKDAPRFYISLISNKEIEHTLFQQTFNEEVVTAVEKTFLQS